MCSSTNMRKMQSIGLIKKQKLDMLHVAEGKEWQDKFRLPEQIPVTLLVDGGKVRIIHDSIMADPGVIS